MAKQVINIGATANDKSGDLLRTAFTKVNDNFTELYARAVNTDAQTLTLNGSALSISGGNSVTLPASGTTLPSLSGNEGKFLRTDGSTLSWVTIIGDGAGLSVTDFGEGFSLTDADKIVTNKLYSTNATNSNVHYRLELDTNGVVRLPDGSIINGSTIRGVAGTGELNYTGITIGPNSNDAEKTWMWVDHANAYITTNNAANTWTFGEGGTLIVPSPNSNLFTLEFAATNYVATDPKPTLTLTGAPWTVQGQYQYAANGDCELILAQIGPNLVNPGYVTGDSFTFGEAVHGIVGHTLTIQLSSVVQAGPAGWTANAAASQPPAYPSSISANGAIKLTASEESLVFGTDGSLTLPPTGTLSTGTINFNGTLQVGPQSITQTQYQFEAIITGEGEEAVYSSKLSLPNIAEIFAGDELSLSTWGSELALKVRNPSNFSDHTWSFGNDGNLTAPGTINAKDQIKIEAADVDTLYDQYQGKIEELANEFLIAGYTGQGYPASKDSIEGLARAKALNPLIPDSWITMATTLRNAYFGWTASSITLTVDSGGFVIANGSGTSWRFEEATGLRFPDNTYQTTAFVGSALRLKSTDGSQTVTLGNDGLVTFPGETGFQATFGSVEPVGDVLHSVNNLHLESEQSVTVNSGNDVFDLYNDYQIKELTWETIRDQNSQVLGPRPWDDLPGYQAYPLLQDYTPTGLELPIPSNMLVAAEEASVAYYQWQNALSGSGVNISVAGSNVWNFSADGRTTFPNGIVPEHSYGAAGDKEGMVVFSDPYIYYCKQDYVNNTTDIWVRVAWTGTNW